MGMIAAASILFGILEYFSHKEYHEKHPDYEKSYSGIIGYIIIAVAALYKAF